MVATPIVLTLPDIYELGYPLNPGMNGNPGDAARQVLAESRPRRPGEIPAAREQLPWEPTT